MRAPQGSQRENACRIGVFRTLKCGNDGDARSGSMFVERCGGDSQRCGACGAETVESAGRVREGADGGAGPQRLAPPYRENITGPARGEVFRA